MKNLMIYVSPTGSFDNPRPDLTSNDAGQLAKVQFENSLALGWKKEDILLFTNFDFQYGEMKANVLKDVEFFERKPQVSKINAIIKLFEKNHGHFWISPHHPSKNLLLRLPLAHALSFCQNYIQTAPQSRR